MLVLSRRRNERIVIDGRITVTVLEVRRNQIRLGIEAPREVPIQREELLGSGVAAGRPAWPVHAASEPARVPSPD